LPWIRELAMRQVFLDHQSATPVLPEVYEAMKPYFSEAYGNPSSLHQHGLRARDALAKARDQVAAFVRAESPEDIIFTSCGAEAVNLAVKGTAYANQRQGNHIVLLETEHPATLHSVEFLEKQGFVSTRLKVDGEGFVNPEEVRSAFTDKTILVCVQCANHDIGTIQPIQQISVMTRERGIPLFVDAVAAAGWMPLDVQALGISLLSLSPHRYYGPKGVGALYRNRRARLASLIHGGAQESGRRAGTENVAAIVGAGIASEIAARELPARVGRIENVQCLLWRQLQANVPHTKLNGPGLGPRRLSTNLNISFEFVEGEGLLLSLDMNGIAIASGTSCASKSLKVSHVLSAIGLDHSLARGSIIITLGKDNSPEEIDYVVQTFAKTVSKLRGMSPLWEEFERGTVQSITKPAAI
jgi:cysteine desulfurase